jgi:3-oxoacid CoA-transferase subunit B
MALDKIRYKKRIAKEEGYFVNLGIVPTLVVICSKCFSKFQSENGVLGMGPFPYERRRCGYH